ncbi:hypothetical protein HDU76_002600 [Blyttiomyces sp. JEL0837]|nr:hypothetical protein HDU76_002600 [Blyttiomyces sp. JEL0837]
MADPPDTPSPGTGASNVNDNDDFTEVEDPTINRSQTFNDFKASYVNTSSVKTVFIVGILFPMVRAALIVMARLISFWSISDDGILFTQEEVLAKEVRFQLTYETFFGIPNKISLLRVSSFPLFVVSMTGGRIVDGIARLILANITQSSINRRIRALETPEDVYDPAMFKDEISNKSPSAKKRHQHSRPWKYRNRSHRVGVENKSERSFGQTLSVATSVDSYGDSQRSQSLLVSREGSSTLSPSDYTDSSHGRSESSGSYSGSSGTDITGTTGDGSESVRTAGFLGRKIDETRVNNGKGVSGNELPKSETRKVKTESNGNVNKSGMPLPPVTRLDSLPSYQIAHPFKKRASIVSTMSAAPILSFRRGSRKNGKAESMTLSGPLKRSPTKKSQKVGTLDDEGAGEENEVIGDLPGIGNGFMITSNNNSAKKTFKSLVAKLILSGGQLEDELVDAADEYSDVESSLASMGGTSSVRTLSIQRTISPGYVSGTLSKLVMRSSDMVRQQSVDSESSDAYTTSMKQYFSSASGTTNAQRMKLAQTIRVVKNANLAIRAGPSTATTTSLRTVSPAIEGNGHNPTNEAISLGARLRAIKNANTAIRSESKADVVAESPDSPGFLSLKAALEKDLSEDSMATSLSKNQDLPLPPSTLPSNNDDIPPQGLSPQSHAPETLTHVMDQTESTAINISPDGESKVEANVRTSEVNKEKFAEVKKALAGDTLGYVDEITFFAVNGFVSIMADWNTRFMAIMMVALVVIRSEWTFCYGVLSYTELAKRIAATIGISLGLDVIITALETTIMAYEFAEIVKLVVRANLTWRIYYLNMMMFSAAFAIMIIVEAGFYTSNECFSPGR